MEVVPLYFQISVRNKICSRKVDTRLSHTGQMCDPGSSATLAFSSLQRFLGKCEWNAGSPLIKCHIYPLVHRGSYMPYNPGKKARHLLMF